jgi:hypothetical protein
MEGRGGKIGVRGGGGERKKGRYIATATGGATNVGVDGGVEVTISTAGDGTERSGGEVAG